MPNNILITPGSASIQFSGSAANTIRLQVEASGSVAFYGNSGSLFGITDQLSGSLMSVNDISGLPILEVFSDDRVVMGSFNRNTLVVTGSRVGIDKAVPTADLDVSGSVLITGSLGVSAGITGSLLGTASLATSSSFATTSSFASTVISSSYAATASVLLGSITSASYAATSSFAISASYAPGGAGLSGGTANYIPLWTGASAQTSSTIYQSSSRNIIIGDTSSKHPTNPPLLEINAASGETEGLHVHGQVNDVFQFNIKNYTSGTSASADIIAIADAGTPGVNNFVAMGINSVAHADSASVGNALDAYLYTTGSDLLIGNISPDKRIILFTGGTRADAYARVYIDATGSVGINTSVPTAAAPEALIVRALTDSYNLITAESNINNYSQINIKNLNGGNTASADIVATANNGNESVNFIDMGINSDQYALANAVGGINDAYLYSTGNQLLIGNATANKDVSIFAGGANAATNQKLLLAANNLHQLTGSLTVSGVVTASLLGTASWASNAISSSFSTTSSFATTASFARSSSFATSAATASYFTGYVLFSNGLDVSGSLVVTGSNITTGSVSATGTGSFSNLLPLADNTGVVGSAALTWANGQFTNLTVDTALTVGDNIQLGPNDQLRMGGATSFVVSHDGTNNYISSDESNLQFRDSATTRITLFRTTGAISASGGVTASGFFGTSSWATNAISSSFATTASYAVSASYAPGGGGLTTKAGSIANSSFTGNPRKAAVLFSTPFANTNYAIVITGEDARSWTYEGKVAAGFTASANSNTALAGTTTWIATAYGET